MQQYAQPIRLLLAYSGTEFEDIRYNYIPAANGTWDRSEWTNVKPNLGLDFPNVSTQFNCPFLLVSCKNLIFKTH
jgi:glutathione S-transferase